MRNKILILDDELDIIATIHAILDPATDLQILDASSAEKALSLVNKNQDIKVILSDIRMPKEDGIEFSRKIKSIYPNIQIIVLTGYPSSDTVLSAIKFSAFDYITKPFNQAELRIAVRKAIQYYDKQKAQFKVRKNLDKTIEEFGVTKLKKLVEEINNADHYTLSHSEQVAKIFGDFLAYLGYAEAEIDQLKLIAYLHDIGKVGILKYIIKDTKLTPHETKLMHEHTLIGYKLLKPISRLKKYAPIVLYCKERYDGSGYPSELKGDTISKEARILTIVEAYDAMQRTAKYRKALSKEEAIKILKQEKSRHFDPELVDKFMEFQNIVIT